MNFENKMKTEAVKGFRDFAGKEAEKRKNIQEIIVRIFEKYGFEPAETPIIEREEFVKGTGSQATDEVISDIFKLKDKGKRKLALRYEFTFQLKRLAKNQKLPYKRYQIGPVFRDEPSSGAKARLRQFTQCDADIIGLSNVPAREEAEILALTTEILIKLGIKPVILINNRKLLNEILDDLKIRKKIRNKVLKEIDKIDKLPEKQVRANLNKIGINAEKVFSAMKTGEDYFNKFPSYKEIISLIDYCKSYGFKVLFSPTVVRGLSYYNGNIFEIKAEGIKETIVAGGSYLVDGTQSTGISFGLERLTMLSKIKSETEEKENQILIVSLGYDREAIKLVQKLRGKGKKITLYYGKPSRALEYANSKKIKKVIFVGEKEVSSGKYKVKDMEKGKESFLK